VKATIGPGQQPVILVGHSYREAVIPAAEPTIALPGGLYLARSLRTADETSQTQLAQFPRTDVFPH